MLSSCNSTSFKTFYLQNPIGVKVSDKMDPRDIVTLIANLNPNNTPGRLTIIVRMGAKAMREKLPKLIEAVQQAGQVVVWVTDPMHGNTETVSGYKTRRFDNIRAEIEVRTVIVAHAYASNHLPMVILLCPQGFL
jgi:3-deoxy-D-arabino-heptulosonate 7-phosphate (DAHP) synthase class II